MKKSVIEIKDMEFYAYHGCFDKEKVIGSRFLISVWMTYDATQAARSDSISDTLNYQQAYEVIKDEMTQSSNLLEHITGRILNALYQHFDPLVHAKVQVSKMNPPMGGQIARVSLTMER